MQIEKSTTGTDVATKGLPWKYMQDGNGMNVKIIDFDAIGEDIMPKSGQIVYEATKKSARIIGAKIIGYGYSCGRDILSEAMVGIPTGIHPKSKEIIFQRMSLFPLNTYDLSIPMQRKQAIVLRYSYIVIGSPNLSANMACHMFREHDVEKAAYLDIQRIEDAQRALTIAKGLKGDELADMARNMGIMPEVVSLPILTAEVMKAAEKRPNEFLEMYESPNRQFVTILKRALDTGLVSFTPMEGYKYNAQYIGQYEPNVYEYFRKYPDVAEALEIKSKDRLKESEKAMAKEAPTTSRKDVDIENALLKKQLAEMQAKLQEASAKNIRTELADEKEPNVELELTLEKLKVEAKELGLGKGLHHYVPTEDSIGKLRTKIEEAKAVA